MAIGTIRFRAALYDTSVKFERPVQTFHSTMATAVEWAKEILKVQGPDAYVDISELMEIPREIIKRMEGGDADSSKGKNAKETDNK